MLNERGAAHLQNKRLRFSFPYLNLPHPHPESAPIPSDPGRLGKLQMDIGENAGSNGEGDGRVDEDGEVREVVEVAALVLQRLIHQRILFLGLGLRAHGGLSGLPSAGPWSSPARAPTRFPASPGRRLGCTDSVAFLRGRLIEQALGLRVRVEIHLLWTPGLARKGTFSHWRRLRAGRSDAET